MTKQDILKEIDWYEKLLISDPKGEDLWNAHLEALRRELKKYETK